MRMPATLPFLFMTAILMGMSVILNLFTVQAQTTDSTKETTTIYKIQLGAYKEIPTEKFDNLSGVFPTYLEDSGKGLKRIIVGDYPSREKAEKVLEKLIEMGHAGAFILTQKVDVPKTEVSKNVSNTPTTSSKKTEPVEKMEVMNVPTNALVTADSEPIFFVQLGAYKTLDLKSFGNIVDLGDLMVENDNGLIKVYISKFVGRLAAEKALSVTKQRGYTEAFIREDK